MYRSASWNRMADDYFLHSWQNGATGMRMSMSYQLMIQPWKWQRRKNVISLQRMLCMLFLLCWFFLPLFYGSFPIHITHSLLLKVNINDVSRLNYCFWWFADVEVGIKTDSVAERIEGLEIEGDVHTDSDGTQTGFLPIDTVDLDVSRTRRTTDHKIFRKLAKRN